MDLKKKKVELYNFSCHNLAKILPQYLPQNYNKEWLCFLSSLETKPKGFTSLEKQTRKMLEGGNNFEKKNSLCCNDFMQYPETKLNFKCDLLASSKNSLFRLYVFQHLQLSDF